MNSPGIGKVSVVSPISSVLAASKLIIFAENGLKMLFSRDLQGFLNQAISSKALIHKQMELFSSMSEQKLPTGISLRGYLSSPAWVTMFTTQRGYCSCSGWEVDGGLGFGGGGGSADSLAPVAQHASIFQPQSQRLTSKKKRRLMSCWPCRWTC